MLVAYRSCFSSDGVTRSFVWWEVFGLHSSEGLSVTFIGAHNSCGDNVNFPDRRFFLQNCPGLLKCTLSLLIVLFQTFPKFVALPCFFLSKIVLVKYHVVFIWSIPTWLLIFLILLSKLIVFLFKSKGLNGSMSVLALFLLLCNANWLMLFCNTYYIVKERFYVDTPRYSFP